MRWRWHAAPKSGLTIVSFNLADNSDCQSAVSMKPWSLAKPWCLRLRAKSFSYHYGFALANLGAASAQRGEVEDGANALAEAYPLLVREDNVVWIFDHVAFLAWRCDRLADAGRLLGFADKERKIREAARDPGERRSYDLTLTGCKARLGYDNTLLMLAERNASLDFVISGRIASEVFAKAHGSKGITGLHRSNKLSVSGVSNRP